MKKKTILIVSKRGFIGGALVRALSSDDSLIVCSYSSEDFNLLDPVQISNVLEKLVQPITIVFLATNGRFPVDDFYVYQRNVQMAVNLLSAAKSRAVEHFIFTSTACVYGRPPLTTPINENTPLQPSGHYGLSKYVSEQLLRYNLNCPLTILRIPGTYGLGDKGSQISHFINRAISQNYIDVWGDGKQLRDFLYIDDTIKILKYFIKDPQNITLNIATGQEASILKIANFVFKALNMKPRIRFTRPEMKEKEFDIYFDISKLRNHFKDIILTTMEEGITKYVDSLKLTNPETRQVIDLHLELHD